jgi:methylated-DNA-[protein]-cysteine S-methyltransferase
MQSEAGSLRIPVMLGTVEISWNSFGLLKRVALETEESAPVYSAEWAPTRVFRFMEDLNAYFKEGTPFSRVSWDDIALDEWTQFQRKVYSATLAIPHGETRTYGWVAQKIGAPLACRAVGQALRKNPVPLLVPCHRVVSHESIGGFMGADHPDAPQLGLKRRLIELENCFINPCFPFSAALGA